MHVVPTPSPPLLGRLLSEVEDRITSVVAAVDEPLLREAVAYAVTGGKRVRPLIALLGAAASGGREEQALDAGVAVELVHAASLVHDDIMDRAEVRRGRAAVYVRYDVPTAVLAGDTLVALAFQLVSRSRSSRLGELLQMFSTAFFHLCEGQAMDLSSPWGGGVDTARHRRAVEKKTARLIEAAAGMGALLADADERTVRSLRSFGLNIGMAFQATDDLLDVSGDHLTLGKMPGADARNARQTFLSLTDPSRRGKELVTAMVEEYTDRACAALQELPDTQARSCLLMMADDLMKRER